MPEWLKNSPFPMPQRGSQFAEGVDWINAAITYATIFFAISLTFVMLFLMIRYRRRPGTLQQPSPSHNVKIEVIWTGVPLIICLVIFYIGYSHYSQERNPPPDALEVNVEAYKWGFNFEYSSGKKAVNELVVPVNKPVKIILRSRDVIHSFYIPAMRVKEDMIKGDYHYLWFTPVEKGEHRILCAEYCGTGHSMMQAKLKVVDEADYQKYLTEGLGEDVARLSPAERGSRLYAEKTCIACHSLDGSRLVGPTFKGLFGKQEELEGGQTILVDENYIRHSIEDPMAQIVKGYPPAMPPFKGQVTEDEIVALTEYIKTLK